MKKFDGLSDEEIYMLSRALIESSYEIQYNKINLYSPEDRDLHRKLLEEIAEERRFRQYFRTEGS